VFWHAGPLLADYNLTYGPVGYWPVDHAHLR
jgi:hypothetical protein